MSSIRLDEVSKSYGIVEVERDIDVDIRTGEFVHFLGPSGRGTSTLLKMIAGLEEIDGVVSNDARPRRTASRWCSSPALSVGNAV